MVYENWLHEAESLRKKWSGLLEKRLDSDGILDSFLSFVEEIAKSEVVYDEDCEKLRNSVRSLCDLIEECIDGYVVVKRRVNALAAAVSEKVCSPSFSQ